ncbi:exodeoxyribonuclease VII large subunit [Alkalicoccus daliensis]|uniref:Exodeoxyribonuclease 7 large subunit n=1 Tax=Alkalicoccus daliensis TaxID=745820 RepID=A0A1H0B4M6_9BACI|nr:exodeoxyribonuclease VII large subunit [Alkalicoccus daliensis]SDN40607.1 Exodeoxyribonuclease VII large subunit [Alkalicoccus daliensis]
MSQQFLSVTDVTQQIKKLLETSARLQNVWIQAEISNFKRHSRGHMYFTLKDDNSRLQSVMFAGSNKSLKFQPENGMSVLVRGDISVYEPFGQYQFYVKEMQPDGIGHLYMAFEQLKKKLSMAGYFEDSIKKKIPRVPSHIGVVTSPTGAAVRDIITTIRRRYPLAKVTLFPVLVQGPQAAASVSKAIYQANGITSLDTLIVGRGGGSLEELWAFNEEIVATAIYKSHIPIISAVGHETDITISDFTADVRAATPTAAAELAVPDIQEMRAFVSERHARLLRVMSQHASQAKERLHRLENSYAFKYPQKLIEEKEQQLDMMHDRLKRSLEISTKEKSNTLKMWDDRLKNVHPQTKIIKAEENLLQYKKGLEKSMAQLLQRNQQKLEMQMSKLDLLSPMNLMKKGYSLAYTSENSLIKSTEQIHEGAQIKLRVKDGMLDCEVKDITRMTEEEK